MGDRRPIAGEPAEWVVAIARLYRDEALWQSMSERSLRFAADHCGFERGLLQMQAALEQAGIFTHSHDTALVARDARD